MFMSVYTDAQRMLVKIFYQPANRLWRSCSWTTSTSTSTCTGQWLTQCYWPQYSHWAGDGRIRSTECS